MFNFKVTQVPRIVLGARFALLGVAALCLFVFDFAGLGIGLALLSVLLGVALRFKPVKYATIKFLTSIDAAAFQSGVPQIRGSRRSSTTASKNAPRDYGRDAVPMSDVAIAEILERTAEPAVRLKRHWPPQETFTGNSHLGGLPSLPDGAQWPVNPATGLALHHLAQIDLAEMPKLDSGAQLPGTGTLWFFADISEDMDWDEGPDTGHSAVLYAPASPPGQQPTPAPDNLPEVDHIDDQMTGSLWAHYGPKFSVYRRWPITGHKTVAWTYSDTKPGGVTDPVAFSTATEERVKAEKARIVGAPPTADRAPRPKCITRVQPENRTNADGKPFVYERDVYAPDLWGGMFPYTARLGEYVLQTAYHHLRSSFDFAERQNKRAEKQNEPPEQRNVDAVKKLGPVLTSATALIDALAQTAPESPLTESDQAAFDALLGACFNVKDVSSNGEGYVLSALVQLVGDALTDPAVLDSVPDAFVATAEGITLPSHGCTEHFLLGPKGSATNPTAGEGIRLAQFDSDNALKFMFCDVGIIDFWIAPEDLAAGRWDRAWAATAGG